jgi:hypothetical protein
MAMIWDAKRNWQQGLLVASMYKRAVAVPCQRRAIMAGGLPGADKSAALAQHGADQSQYLTISIGLILEEMAARDLIPSLQGLSPLDASELVHGEARFVAKRLGLRALADGRNVIFDISMASLAAVESWIAALRQAGYTVTGIFVDISIEESVCRTEAEHRRKHEEYRNGIGYGGRYIRPEAIRALAATVDDLTQAQTPAPPASLLPAAARTAADSAVAVFPGGEVSSMIAAYHAGQRTLDDLVFEVQARRWPAVPSATSPGMEESGLAVDDPEPYVPCSFDDVVLAYDLGHLTDRDYQALATPAAL